MRACLGFALAAAGCGAERVPEAEAAPQLVEAAAQQQPRTPAGAERQARSSLPLDLEQSPYTDTTPLCHYLERGINDFLPDETDAYVVSTPTVKTLADIDHITLGLDLPLTHCQDNPRSSPCAPEDLDLNWCVERLALYASGIKLYDRTGGNVVCGPDGCSASNCIELIRAGGGHRPLTITDGELRSNENWGLTVAELEGLFPSISFAGGKASLTAPGIEYSSAQVARNIEGIVGDYMARKNKGCAPNDEFCANQRKQQVLWASSGEVDCDLGNCPAKSQRQPSPWLEISGDPDNDRIHVDADVQLQRGVADGGDCIPQAPGGAALWCGNAYGDVVHGSLSLDLGFRCETHRHSVFRGDASHELPPCPERRQTIESRCFRSSNSGQPYTVGQIECPPGDDHEMCGEQAQLLRSSYALTVVPGTPSLHIEGGMLPALVSFFCLGQCDRALANAINDKIHEKFDTSALNEKLFKGLDGCPPVSVQADGGFSVDLLHLDTCPPGSHDFHCLPWTQFEQIGKGGQGQPQTQFGAAEPEPPVLLEYVAFANAHARQRSSAVQMSKRSAKIPMRELDEGWYAACAAAKSCADKTDPAALPLVQFVTLDFDHVKDLAEAGDTDGLLDELGFLIGNDEFKNSCVGEEYPEVERLATHDVAYLMKAGEWFQQFYIPRFLAEGRRSCRAAGGIESHFPVIQLELRIRSGDNASDNFAFASFEDPQRVTDGQRDKYGCAHIESKMLAPSDAPLCGSDGRIAHGPEHSIGEVCGTFVGGPCADMRQGYYTGIAPAGSRPDHPAWHPNGDFAWYGRCERDLFSDRPMSCIAESFTGAGVNLTGVCKICGAPGGDDATYNYTMIGCEPTGPACPSGLTLAPDGKCWDSATGSPEWECDGDCGDLYGHDRGYCVHHGPWRSRMQDIHPEFNQPQTYQDPICAERLACPQRGVDCASRGLACDPDPGVCVEECRNDADCHAVDPPPRYPSSFRCDTNTGTCKLN